MAIDQSINLLTENSLLKESIWRSHHIVNDAVFLIHIVDPSTARLPQNYISFKSVTESTLYPFNEWTAFSKSVNNPDVIIP